MSQYIAKKALLDQKKECSNRACGCYTENGYYIKYTNRNVDGILFVCEECFNKKYRSSCNVQEFQTKATHSRNISHHKVDNPTIRSIIRGFNKSVRCLRYILLCVMIICTIIVIANSGKYELRSIDFQGSKNVHVTSTVGEKIDNITQKIQYLLTEERK